MKAKVIKTGEVVDVYHEPQHGQITNIYKESVLVNSRMWTEDELDFSVKVNEAQKKIYLNPLLMEDGESIVRRCTFERQRDSQIEYTRTDAFIERACDYLQKNLWKVVLEENEFRQRFVTDFKNYMEGE